MPKITRSGNVTLHFLLKEAQLSVPNVQTPLLVISTSVRPQSFRLFQVQVQNVSGYIKGPRATPGLVPTVSNMLKMATLDAVLRRVLFIRF